MPWYANRAVILLGEHHDSAPDHRWQLQSIETLFAANPHMAIGFEMFPRKHQPILDRWVRGELDEKAFLDAVDWKHAWGGDAELYMPIFRFARDHHLSMLALNVDRALPRRVSKEGWEKIPVSEREGIGDPAPPDPAYRDHLAEIMSGHSKKTTKDQKVDRFVAAQLLWDRAMAEGIAGARAGKNPPLVAAIMGAGHMENRYGVPHQLKALGIDDVAVLIPFDHDVDDCGDLGPTIADAIYGVVADRKSH